MAVFKNGIFAYDNGRPVTPQQVGIDYPGIQTCQQFFSSGSITNVTQRSALYILVGDLQNYGIWNKMKAIYPMVGQAGVSSSFELNLKDPNTFKGTFYGTWSFNENGATPDGTSAYMDTGILGNTNLSSNNVGIGIYSRSQTTAIGAFGTGQNFHIYARFVDNNTYYRLLDSNASGINNGTSLGFIHGYANSSVGNGFLNQTKVSTNSIVNSLESANVYFGGRRPSPSNYDNHQIALSFVSEYLTDTEATNLYTAVQRFQTTLGRQV